VVLALVVALSVILQVLIGAGRGREQTGVLDAGLATWSETS